MGVCDSKLLLGGADGRGTDPELLLGVPELPPTGIPPLRCAFTDANTTNETMNVLAIVFIN